MTPLSDLDLFCAKAKGFTSDSRVANDDLIFVALSGSSFDGAKFIDSVLTKFPRSYAVTENAKAFANLSEALQSRTLLVESAHAAHRHIAKNFRIKFTGKVIAVGGSNGKTSTKEFLHHILSKKFRCIKTQASQNGELGIPKTLESLYQAQGPVDVAVVEVGIDGPGDMIRHAELVRPNIAVLTSIGEEHLNLLKSVEGVFREERILADWCVDYGGQVVVPSGNDYLDKLVKEGKAIHASPLPEHFKHNLTQKHFLSNLSICVTVAKLLGMTDSEIQASLGSLKIPEGRGVLKEHGEGVWIYEDFYNANSSSMKAGIDSAGDLAAQKKLPFRMVLGDMFDLGDQEDSVHQHVLEYAIATKPSSLVLIGERFSRAALKLNLQKSIDKIYASKAAALSDQKSLFAERGLYLLKGSRGMQLEALCGNK